LRSVSIFEFQAEGMFKGIPNKGNLLGLSALRGELIMEGEGEAAAVANCSPFLLSCGIVEVTNS
jgi:hypothetical protein